MLRESDVFLPPNSLSAFYLYHCNIHLVQKIKDSYHCLINISAFKIVHYFRMTGVMLLHTPVDDNCISKYKDL